MSFPCRAIWHNKKWFKKREFFVPHHLAQKKRFEKREFFVPDHFVEKKTVQKT